MTLKSRPKTVFATLASLSLLGTPLLLPTTASAGDISLTLQSEYTEPAFENDSEGKRVRRMKTEIELDEGQVFSFPIATGLHYNPKASFHMSFHVSEEADQNVSIEITICELTDAPMMKKGAMFALDSINACEGEKIMAQPTIKAKYGETAEFRFEVEHPLPSAEMHETSEVEFSENNRKVFKLTASPKKL